MRDRFGAGNAKSLKKILASNSHGKYSRQLPLVGREKGGEEDYLLVIIDLCGFPVERLGNLDHPVFVRPHKFVHTPAFPAEPAGY